MTPEITIHNITEFTDEQIIDFAAAKLAEQNCKSQDADGRCLYRGPNGTKCGFGFFIPDEDYESSFEHRAADDLIVLKFPKAKEKRDLVRAIQLIHDNKNVEDWQQCFKQLKRHLNEGCNPITAFHSFIS